MIKLTNLTYTYRGGVEALHDVNAEIGPGVHLLLGENGAGKTTMLHLIAGLLKASPAETCTLDGVPTSFREPATLGRLFMFTDNMQFPFRTIDQMVRRHAVFYPTFDVRMLQENLREFGMTGFEQIDRFSLGNRRKAMLAYVLALRTQILLLDEPANGLDITAKQTALQMMARCISPEQTVIISTHTVWDFQNLFDGLIVITRGNLALSMPTEEITRRVAFVSSDNPVEGAIYLEPTFGRFNAILPANEKTEGETDIDYTLLYNALHSTQAQQLINHLNA